MFKIQGQLKKSTANVFMIAKDLSNDIYIISTSLDGKIFIWNIQKMESVYEFAWELGPVSSIALQYPDFALSYSKDGKIRIYNAQNKNSIVLTKNLREAFLLVFQGEQIIVGSHDKNVYIWDFKNKIILRTIAIEAVQDLVLNLNNKTQLIHISYAGQIKFINFIKNKVHQNFTITGAFEIFNSHNGLFKIIQSHRYNQSKMYLVNTKNRIVRIIQNFTCPNAGAFSKNSKFIYFIRQKQLCQLNISTFKEDVLGECQQNDELRYFKDDCYLMISQNVIKKIIII